jgi:hypothetical protein
MSKIYRIISSFTQEQSETGMKQFSEYELKMIIDLLGRIEMYTFKYDGKVCHWREGELEYNILFCSEKEIDEVRKYDNQIHNDMEGYTTIDDITEDVLLNTFDTSVFGFFQFEMNYDFFNFRKEYLTKDILLDKILKYGKDSLTENDKLFLEDKDMISPLDNL